MDWFRMYDSVLDDPKVQQHIPDKLFKRWINLLCLASRNPVRGCLPPIKDIAFNLRLSLKEAENTIDTLISVGLIDFADGIATMHNWAGRQFQSDNSTERVKRFRGKSETVSGNKGGSGAETLLETPPEQIQNRTEQKQKQRTPKPPSAADAAPGFAFGNFYALYPRKKSRAAAEVAWNKALKRATAEEIIGALQAQIDSGEFAEDPTKRPYPATWLNGRRWEDVIQPKFNGNRHSQIGASEVDSETTYAVEIVLPGEIQADELFQSLTFDECGLFLSGAKVEAVGGQTRIKVQRQQTADWWKANWERIRLKSGAEAR